VYEAFSECSFATGFFKVRGAFFIERKADGFKPLKFRVFQTKLHIDPEYAKNEKV
jgi:hypothetical protein